MRARVKGEKPMCAIEDKMVPAEWGVSRKRCDRILFDNQSNRGKTEGKWNTRSSVDHKIVSGRPAKNCSWWDGRETWGRGEQQ